MVAAWSAQGCSLGARGVAALSGDACLLVDLDHGALDAHIATDGGSVGVDDASGNVLLRLLSGKEHENVVVS